MQYDHSRFNNRWSADLRLDPLREFFTNEPIESFPIDPGDTDEMTEGKVEVVLVKRREVVEQTYF